VVKIAQGSPFFVVKTAHFGIFICGFSCRTASSNDEWTSRPPIGGQEQRACFNRYVGPRLPRRRDRLVRRLEEISDDASAHIAARAFRTWAIAEGLLAE